MERGVVTHHMPCNLQTLRCNHLLLHSKNLRKPRHLSCKATSDRVDRRGVLLSGAAAVAGGLATQRNNSAIAAPIRPPDLGNCRPIQHDNLNCCPPYCPTTEIVDFRPPSDSSLRKRRAAHRLVNDQEYLCKYELAVARMKALPDSDPRSFSQQWRVHCAYCEGAYPQVGFPDREIQIHGGWLFFPWHRLYLYFHERILGKLIGDDNFALPFWNWDAREGMTLPAIYTNEHSLLYDKKRNPMHQPPVTVDLDYGCHDDNPTLPREEKNLKIMYRQMVSNTKTKELFFGKPYRQGDMPHQGSGNIELLPHNTVHNWTGDPNMPNCGEDMGVLRSAARDPVFFAHHGNIDRMWNIWKTCLPTSPNTDLTCSDWLDASFLFYDEEARLVRVHVRDCLDTTALGYTYEDVHLDWLQARPSVAEGDPELADGPTDKLFPRTLDNETVRAEVERKKILTSPKKEGEEEVLVIRDIEIANYQRRVKFDVFVNAPKGLTDTAAAQCVGSVALTPHAKQGSMKQTEARFGISDLLQAIHAEGAEKVVVSIVPRSGGDAVTIGGVSI
ncbi:unnamed protein product [Urochloa decumbens]|uniref:Tyrosinase copper-binding domain-containing protein n=1 Tax=Urochloa decumbens TaxID=240449 RepID=A0ABC9AMU1_9POAL